MIFNNNICNKIPRNTRIYNPNQYLISMAPKKAKYA